MEFKVCCLVCLLKLREDILAFVIIAHNLSDGDSGIPLSLFIVAVY